MVRLSFLLIAFVVVMALSASGSQVQAQSCTQQFEAAVARFNEACSGIGRNTVCRGAVGY